MTEPLRQRKSRAAIPSMRPKLPPFLSLPFPGICTIIVSSGIPNTFLSATIKEFSPRVLPRISTAQQRKSKKIILKFGDEERGQLVPSGNFTAM